MAEQCLFFARITEPLYGTDSQSQDFAEGDIVRVIDATIGAYLVIPEDVQDDGTDPVASRSYASWVLHTSVQRLCGICEEEPATQAAQFHRDVMLCAGCAASEPGWEQEYQEDCAYEQERLRLLASQPALQERFLARTQGSQPWHIEEA